MAIIVSGASYTAAIIPGLVIALYLLQSFYLRTSRQMRHMDLEAKTPLYTLFTEVASGLQHIRAFNWQTTFMDRGLQLLDVSQKPYYLLFCIQRWLTFVLDMFVMAIAVVLVTIAVKITSTTSETAIGLALVNLVGYGESLAQLIQFMSTNLLWRKIRSSLVSRPRIGLVPATLTYRTSVQDTGEHQLNLF
jgi:ATP-binding cassette subfamily C (CFTR/MRP) protein 1